MPDYNLGFPFINTVDKKWTLDKYYRRESQAEFSTKVADSLYLRNDYHDIIMKLIADSKLLPQKNTDTVTSHLSFWKSI
jgi:hypothetical protein